MEGSTYPIQLSVVHLILRKPPDVLHISITNSAKFLLTR